MVHRASARRRVLQHARRALFVLAAGSLLLTSSPVFARFSDEFLPEPVAAPRPLSAREISEKFAIGPLVAQRSNPPQTEMVSPPVELPWDHWPFSSISRAGDQSAPASNIAGK